MFQLTTNTSLRGALLAAAITTLSGAACKATTSAPAPAPVSTDTWAVVDGRNITKDDVDKAYRRTRDTSTPMSDEETLVAKLNLLNDMIVQDILLQRAKTKNLAITEAELDTAYNDAKKNIADDQFQQELTARGLTPADMRDGLRRDLLIQKVVEQDITPKLSVTDQEITAFFNSNRAQFNIPEEAYRLAQIVVTPVPEQQIANQSGDDAQTPQAATAKVQMLMERLKSGAAFPDLAVGYSEDPETAPRGGDLGLVPVSRLRQAPPALRNAVLGKEPGQVNVVSENGAYTLVLVVAHEQAGQRDLSTPGVKDQISQGLRGRKEQLLRAAYLTAARSDASVTNYLARRIVEANGPPPGIQLSSPAGK
jgi:peptidyl-prolyl cis-trans isomerase SurA